MRSCLRDRRDGGFSKHLAIINAQGVTSLMVVLAWALVAAASVFAQSLDTTSRHVRGLDAAAGALLQTADERSPTVSQLLSELDQSDMIVGVQTIMFAVPGTGDLTFLASAGGWRHVRIRIERRASIADQIAWLGHELRHATEIASSPVVCDVTTLKAFYARAGRQIAVGRYETAAAGDVFLQVRREATTDKTLSVPPGIRYSAAALCGWFMWPVPPPDVCR